MKRSTLEPGLFQAMKFLAILQVLGIPFVRRTIRAAMGIEVPLERWPWFWLTSTVPLLLVAYTWIPWWQKRLGCSFLPFFIIIGSINAILVKYLTLSWLVPPAQQELSVLLLLVNLWIHMHVATVLVAWQYSWAWVLLTSLAFSLADGALSLPFIVPGAPLYSLFLFIFLSRAATVTLAALGAHWLVHRLRKQREALAEANRKLARYAAATEQLAASHERNRLARELHDTLAHSLSGVAVQLEAVQALWEVNAAEARRILDQALRATRLVLTEARRALQSLRASPLEDLGLGLAVSDLAKSAAGRANLKLDLDVQDHLENISLEVEQCVYRVAQEAVTNITRHANAESLRVSLARKNGGLILTVADDGRGFDPAMVNGLHFGLKGLRERAEMIGGRLEVHSQPGHGTTVKLTIMSTSRGTPPGAM